MTFPPSCSQQLSSCLLESLTTQSCPFLQAEAGAAGVELLSALKGVFYSVPRQRGQRGEHQQSLGGVRDGKETTA